MAGPLSGKRIGLLTASASRLGGGVFEAVVRQAQLVRDLGGEAVVLAQRDRHAEEDRGRFGPSQVVLADVLGPAQIGYAPGLLRELHAARLDLLHLHGIWMYPSRAATLWARATGRACLISPHGMLDPWITARGRWKKALARRGYERASWAAARRMHALTRSEAADIARAGAGANSLVIPNAAPEPTLAPDRMREPEFLYLGRIHSKKNLAALLQAWTALTCRGALPAAARLTIAGWGDEADVAALRCLLAAVPDSVQFVGPVFGADKQRLLDTARFLILPSLSEGLPMAVLEAWSAGTPVLMSAHCHLPEGFAKNAAIDCGTDPAKIAQALTRAATIAPDDWQAMAQAAQGLARGPFAHATIASRWGEAYAALMEPGR
jgi:poly(glycerol-phosphate) alpha-glucosyltransferase